MSRFILPRERVFNNNANPLDGALLYFYESGTNTPLDTYSDDANTTANTNPVVADGNGEFGDIFLQSKLYRVELKDKDGVTQSGYPVDDVFTNSNVGTIASEIVDNFASLRSGTPVNGASVYLQYHTTREGGGGGEFIGVTGAAAGTYVDDNGFTIVPTGGDGSAAWLRTVKGSVNVRYFGAIGDYDPSTATGTDDTVAIQAAINTAATLGKRLYIPAGVYQHKRLYLEHDPVNNPDYPADSRSGKLIIEGDGQMSVNARITGTWSRSTLYCTATTVDGLVMSGAGAPSFSYYGQMTFENISFVSESAGWVANLDGFLNSNMKNVFVWSKAGKGIRLRNCFNTSLDNVYISGGLAGFNKRVDLYSLLGSGLDIDIGGGRFNTRNVNVSGFPNGMLVTGNSLVSTHIGFEANNCMMGVNIQGNNTGMTFIEPIFENNTYSNIYVNSAGIPPNLVGGLYGAVFPAWATGNAVAVGDVCRTGVGMYIATQAGTTGATAPTGTGTGIADGTVIWDYMIADNTIPKANIRIVTNETSAGSMSGGNVVLDQGTTGVLFDTTSTNTKYDIKTKFTGAGSTTNRTLLDIPNTTGSIIVDCVSSGLAAAGDVDIAEPRNCEWYRMNDSARAEYTRFLASVATLDTRGCANVRVSGTATITALATQPVGSTVRLVFLNSGCTVKHTAGVIVLNNAVDFVSSGTGRMTLTLTNANGSTWHEV